MTQVSSAKNHGTVSRCYWDGTAEVPDLKGIAGLSNGELAYLLSQISGQWTVKEGAVVLKAATEEATHRVTLSCGKTTTLCYTDASGKLLTLPENPAIEWSTEVPLNERVFTENTEVFGILRGDTDGNGTLDTADATLILQYLVGEPVEVELQFADCNADGRISVYDAVTLLRALSA